MRLTKQSEIDDYTIEFLPEITSNAISNCRSSFDCCCSCFKVIDNLKLMIVLVLERAFIPMFIA